MNGFWLYHEYWILTRFSLDPEWNLPTGFWMDSERIMNGFRMDSEWLNGFRMDSSWILNGIWMDSHWSLNGFRKGSEWIPKGFWMDSEWALVVGFRMDLAKLCDGSGESPRHITLKLDGCCTNNATRPRLLRTLRNITRVPQQPLASTAAEGPA